MTLAVSQPESAMPMAGPLIEMRRVGKTYATRTGDIVAVEEASLAIGDGETIALLGPSGCGKSTLLMMIAGQIAPTTGSLTIAGRPVKGPSADLGVVFQKDLLLDWKTVLENVLLPFELRGEESAPYKSKALALLSRVGLAKFEHKRPFELSGGMRQRVAICRAWIQDPNVLLLDEPFAALDAFTREQMQLDVARLSLDRPRTTILVTHEIPEAVFMADRVAVMTARPSQIREIVEIDLPRPRTVAIRESAAFGKYVTHIHSLFTNLGVLHG